MDKDPQEYVRGEEERQGLLDERGPDGESANGGGSVDGSLSIGSLRTP